jgi:hypothetical protein
VLPQWTGFADSELGWRWHVPLFPVLIALWQKCFGISLLSIRLFTILPAAAVIAIAAMLCRSLAGKASRGWLLFWLALLASDKVFVTNALMGRMEFHALLWVLLAFCVALRFSQRKAVFAAGILLGVGVGFHPLAAFFTPALAGLLWWRKPAGQRVQSVLLMSVGLAIPLCAWLAWFLSDWHLTKEQLLVASKQSGGSFVQSSRELIPGFLYCYRIQPAFEVATVLSLALLAYQFVAKRFAGSERWKSYTIAAALAGYVLFLLRGSTQHYNYYIGLSVPIYLLIAWAMGRLSAAWPRLSVVILAAMGLLLLNNLVFAAGKTYVVWQNRGLKDPTPMRTFLTEQTRGAKRILVPPNLWLIASQNQWDYRFVYTPVVNTSLDVWHSYHEQLLAWDPDVIILDLNMLPPLRQSLSPDEVERAGYVKAGEFTRVFARRYDLYSGYKLVVYRKGPRT